MQTRFKLSADDTVIAVMGITGSGKSTFISKLTGLAVAVGDTLESCTSEVNIYRWRTSDKTIYIVDTPGFDDTHISEVEVLKRVATFLSAIYSEGIKLAGIVYLHRITDNKMAGSAYRNVAMFRKLCGTEGLKNVILATTMWPAAGQAANMADLERREAELRDKPDFWGTMIQRGSIMMRHQNTPDSALRIIETIIERHTSIVLDIQRQMVDNNQTLEETSAGQEVRKEMIEVEKKMKEELENIRENMQIALDEKDEAMAESLTKLQHQFEAKLAAQEREREDLKKRQDTLQKEERARYDKLAREMQAERKKYQRELENTRRESQTLQDRIGSAETRLQEAMSKSAAEQAESEARMARLREEFEEEAEERESRAASNLKEIQGRFDRMRATDEQKHAADLHRREEEARAREAKQAKMLKALRAEQLHTVESLKNEYSVLQGKYEQTQQLQHTYEARLRELEQDSESKFSPLRFVPGIGMIAAAVGTQDPSLAISGLRSMVGAASGH